MAIKEAAKHNVGHTKKKGKKKNSNKQQPKRYSRAPRRNPPRWVGGVADAVEKSWEKIPKKGLIEWTFGAWKKEKKTGTKATKRRLDLEMTKEGGEKTNRRDLTPNREKKFSAVASDKRKKKIAADNWAGREKGYWLKQIK